MAEKQNANIEFIIVMIIFLGIIAVFVLSLKIQELESEIDNMPHKYCHIEKELQKINPFDKSDFPLNAEILCDKDIEIKKYKFLDKQSIYTCFDSRGKLKDYCEREATCIIVTKKEVCEIR